MADEFKLVKYITEQVVMYMETPKQERKRETVVKETWSTKWFGMIPISLALLRDKSPNESEREQQQDGKSLSMSKRNLRDL
ncbi:YqzE family protein [Paenibacillus sp. IHBB 10380]|uniref:YqzE family protein n=1 Tax=Paenibacillus sp. IHBB 10380 TaxID=1566358 RepID=UPI0005CF9AF3|nr:YqzE family protein [Paenibacillus sp. IHBB 10380]AJS59398.1 hypothetical protein UB51_14040 [Paenibacillus sp. IHBB 10380]